MMGDHWVLRLIEALYHIVKQSYRLGDPCAGLNNPWVECLARAWNTIISAHTKHRSPSAVIGWPAMVLSPGLFSSVVDYSR